MDANIPYKLSQDYKLLWDLIAQGHTIVGYVHSEIYNNKFELVGIRYTNFGYMIGTRGVSYGGLSNSFDSFLNDCTNNELRFILP